MGIIAAEILSILWVILWVIGFIFLGLFFAALNSTYTCSYYHCPPNPYIGTELIAAIAFVILAIPSILLLSRIGIMRKVANDYGFLELRTLNTVGLPLIVLVLNGVVPSIILLEVPMPVGTLVGWFCTGVIPSIVPLIARGPIAKLKAQPTPAVQARARTER